MSDYSVMFPLLRDPTRKVVESGFVMFPDQDPRFLIRQKYETAVSAFCFKDKNTSEKLDLS